MSPRILKVLGRSYEEVVASCREREGRKKIMFLPFPLWPRGSTTCARRRIYTGHWTGTAFPCWHSASSVVTCSRPWWLRWTGRSWVIGSNGGRGGGLMVVHWPLELWTGDEDWINYWPVVGWEWRWRWERSLLLRAELIREMMILLMDDGDKEEDIGINWRIDDYYWTLVKLGQWTGEEERIKVVWV